MIHPLLRKLLGVLLFPTICAHAFAVTFTTNTQITINSGSAATPATPYPSTINVSAVPGAIQKVTVRLTNLSHTWPDDIDVLLVAPNGAQALLMSDAGGSNDLIGTTLWFDDDAPVSLPDGGQILSGTYRPTNYGSPDDFPSPAPPAGTGAAFSAFIGGSPNGEWKLFVMDDTTGDAGTMDGWALTITTADPAQPGQLVISEFRFRGPNGANDEYIEIHNATDTGHMVSSADDSGGYMLVASDGFPRALLLNGTIIPARGHLLVVNSYGYSLSSHPAGNNTTASGDHTFGSDIPDNGGVALFRSATNSGLTLANRLDAVGSTSVSNALYREGSGFPAIYPYNVNCAFHRDLRKGVAKDTNDNAADFVFVDTNGTSAGASQRLGAPGPENLSSPARLPSGLSVSRKVLDPYVALSASPNRIRNHVSNPANNSTFGTLQFTRKFTNTTGSGLSRVRFRIVDLSTFPSPSGVADLRPLTSSDTSIAVTGGATASVFGTHLEEPPSQPNGGGINSTLSLTSLAPPNQLGNGGTIAIRFVFGIQQTGQFKVAMMPEALPASASAVWIVSGDTENASAEVEIVEPAAVVNVNRLSPDVSIDYTCPPGLLYQMQSSMDLKNWSSVGSTISGTGWTQNYVHAGGAAPQKQFYRLKRVP